MAGCVATTFSQRHGPSRFEAREEAYEDVKKS